MWKCKKCGEENEDSFESCWNCGTGYDGVSPTNPQEFEEIKDEVIKNIETSEEYVSTYETTRIITKLVSFIGWVVVVISLLVFLIVVIKSSESRYGFNWLALLPALGGFISGLLLVISGQFTRATVDSADNTGQILELLKSKRVK